MIAAIVLAYFVGFIASFVYWQTKAERACDDLDTVLSAFLSVIWPVALVVFLSGLICGAFMRAIGLQRAA